MAKSEYPALAKHKEEHDKLVQDCLDLQKKFRAGQAEVTQQTTAFVKDWLVTHIPNIDRAYGPVMNAKGIA
jgi:hemerythrin